MSAAEAFVDASVLTLIPILSPTLTFKDPVFILVALWKVPASELLPVCDGFFLDLRIMMKIILKM
jgi:hypothetical protein